VSEIRVRKYHRRDRPAVLGITQRSFQGFCMESNIEEHFGTIADTDWAERKKNGIEYDLRRHRKHAFVAEMDGEVVGFLCSRVYRSIEVGHVANMAVAPEYQGRGAGKKLLEAALEHFREEGLSYARIETLEQNYKGRKLYPNFGFEEIGKQIFYFREL
jgi:ribosomal protein S18 acetylase RimI-like enzyme